MPEAILAIAKPDNSYPEFAIPDGLDLSGLKDGETKEVLAVIQKKDDGNICVTTIDGVKLRDEKPDEPEPEEPDDQASEQPYPQRMMAQAKSAGLM